MSSDVLGLERQVCIVMKGGVMPMCMRLVPASTCCSQKCSPIRLLHVTDFYSKVHLTSEVLHTGITVKHWYNSSMGTIPDPSSLMKWLVHHTISNM